MQRTSDDQKVLETRPPNALYRAGARLAAAAAIGSALWAYVEYAGAARPELLALALAGVCFGAGTTVLLAFRGAFAFRTVQAPRPEPPPPEPPVDFGHGTRRGLLALLVAGASSVVAVALLPLRSLGPRPRAALHATAWRRGVRLVTPEGTPLRPGDLPPGSSMIVVPAEAPDDGNSAVTLVRLRGSGRLRAYSRICTHAGCAVSVFLQERSQLVCPCHHSTFDAADGGRILAGPASGPLPELPITVDEAGVLVADGDFDRPIGPRVG